MEAQRYPGQQATLVYRGKTLPAQQTRALDRTFDLREKHLNLQPEELTKSVGQRNVFMNRSLPIPKQVPLPTVPRSEGFIHPDSDYYWRKKGTKQSVAHWAQYEDRFARHMLRTQRPYPNSQSINPSMFSPSHQAEIPVQTKRPFYLHHQPLAGKTFSNLPYHGAYTFEHISEEAARSRVPSSGVNQPVPDFDRVLKQPIVEGPMWEAPPVKYYPHDSWSSTWGGKF